MDTGKRIGIFFFFDAEGIVDDYNTFLLRDLKQSMDRLLIVVNGTLNDAGRAKFSALTDDLIVRENKGFDSWAYKAGLEYLGWDEVRAARELIMLNHTNFGPVYPFAEVFAEMDKRTDDFWGITMYHKVDTDPYDCCEYGYLPDHIQSHFIAFRHRMLNSEDFFNYWRDLPEINSYSEAVGKHEARLTKHFNDLGYTSSVYCDLAEGEEIVYPLMTRPMEMVSEKRCPIFKRKTFSFDYDYFIRNTAGEQGRELLNYLRDHTSYPVDLVWQNMIRTTPMSELVMGLQMCFIMDGGAAMPQQAAPVALLMSLSTTHGMKCAMRHAACLPRDSGLFAAVSSDVDAKQLETLAEASGLHVTVHVCDGNLPDGLGLCGMFSAACSEYGIIGCATDVMPEYVYVLSAAESATERGFDCLIGEKGEAAQRLALFDTEPRLGMLCVREAQHANYFSRFGFVWDSWHDELLKVMKKLKLSLPVSKAVEPINTRDGFFWIRSSVLKKMLAKRADICDAIADVKREDEYAECAPIIRTMLFSLFAQQEELYTAELLSKAAAQTDLTNLTYYLKSFNSEFLIGHGYIDRDAMRELMKKRPDGRHEVRPSHWNAIRMFFAGQMDRDYIRAAIRRHLHLKSKE